MKTVFNKDQIAHEWAKASPDTNARTSADNFSASGLSLVSYSTEIGRILPATKKRGPVVLLSANQFSATTAGHLSLARYATNHWQSFEVPHQGYYTKTLSIDLAEIANQYLGEIDSLFALASKAKGRKADYLEQIKGKVATLRELFAALDLKISKLPAGDRKRLEIAESVDLTAHKGELTTRQRNAARARSRADKERETERLRREEVQREKAVEMLPEWRRGLNPQHHGVSFYYLPVALRLSEDGEHIETSHGASVDLRAACLLFRALGRGEALHGKELSGYTITAVTAESVKVGCHEIPRSEIDALLPSLCEKCG